MLNFIRTAKHNYNAYAYKLGISPKMLAYGITLNVVFVYTCVKVVVTIVTFINN